MPHPSVTYPFYEVTDVPSLLFFPHFSHQHVMLVLRGVRIIGLSTVMLNLRLED